MRVFQILPFLILGFFSGTRSSARAELPVRPEFGILDQASLFSLPILKAAERVLAEHERLTQEQVSIFTTAGHSEENTHEDAKSFSESLAEEWRKTAARPPSSVLIFVDKERGHLEIRTGFGLDPEIPSEKITEIEKKVFRPEWKNREKTRAVVLTLLEVLKNLESPLVASGEATLAFERAGFSGGWIPLTSERGTGFAWVFVVLGISFSILVLSQSLIREVHYTATGWFRVTSAQRIRRFIKRIFRRKRGIPSLVTGGGVSGTY